MFLYLNQVKVLIMTINEEIQTKYIELQQIDGQLKQLQQQMQMLDAQMDEIDFLIQSLDDFKNVKEGQEVLAPLASGIFFKTKLQKNDEFLVNVGSGVVTKKSTKEVKEMLDEQRKQMTELQGRFTEDFSTLGSQAMKIEKELTELSKKG